MTKSAPDALSQPLFPHAETVETILGVPLLIEDSNDAPPIPTGRLDAREAAYDYVLSAITKHTKTRADEGVSLDLSAEQLATISGLDDIRFLANEVSIAHNVRANLKSDMEQPAGADAPDTPRARFQSTLLGQIATHLTTLPDNLQYADGNDLRYRIDDGLAVVAPTGSGKTIVEAMTLRLTGVGNPGQRAKDEKAAVVVTPTEKLVEQFMGQSGNNTFQRFLGENVKVVPFYGKRKSKDGDVCITTPRSIHLLSPEEYSRLLIDEGHTGLQKKFFNYLGRVGLRSLLFTATPAYSEKRDLRNYYKHIEARSMRQFIEEGILNPTRLLSFRYKDNPELMAAQLALNYIEEGRSVAVYCQPGQSSKQAQDVAGLINKLSGSKVPLAASVGNHNPLSNLVEEDFDNKKIKALTTCKRLREGWDADVDVGIFIGPNTSALDLEQKMGRIVRPGKHVSELIELLPEKTLRKLVVSIWEVMGLENIQSELIIGGQHNNYAPVGEASGPQTTKRTGQWSSSMESLRLDRLPEDLVNSLVDGRPLRTILLDGRIIQAAPKDHYELGALAAKHQVPVRWLQIQLDAAGIPYQGIRCGREGGQSGIFQRWYAPEVATYLKENPVPKLAAATEMTRIDIANMCGVSEPYVKRIIDELELESIERLTQVRHLKYPHYSFEAILTIMLELENTPHATEDDVPLSTLSDECGRGFTADFVGTYGAPKNGVALVQKWRVPVDGLTGITIHLSKADAERLREAKRRMEVIPIAVKGQHYSYREVATAAGLSYDTFAKNITDADEARAIVMRKNKRSLPGKYFTKADGDALIERLKPQPLPAHLVHAAIFDRRVPNLRSILSRWLRDNDEESVMVRLIGGSRATPCITWQQLQKAEAQMGTRPGTPSIDWERVVQGAEDADAERFEYSQSIQKKYVDGKMLTPTPGPKPIQIDDRIRRELVAATRGVKTRIPGGAASPAPENKAQTPAPVSRVIPPNFVKLEDYLASRNARCNPQLLVRLAQQSQLGTPQRDTKDGLWGPQEMANGLEAVITKRFPIADEGMSTPSQIAKRINKQFSLKSDTLIDLHVIHVARNVVSSFEGHTFMRRTLEQDGTPGMLDIHYGRQLTELIEKRVHELLSQSRLSQILRYGKL